MSSIKSNNYIELLDDRNDDLISAEILDASQNRKDQKPYFKVIDFKIISHILETWIL